MATLELRALRKSYGDLEVVHGVDLHVAHQEFIVLVGPSGCGKSTVLRMIAGLEEISGGEILIDDQVVNEREPKDRDIAMVFQDYALYPHMSVFENMAFSLQYRGFKKPEIRQRVLRAAEILSISELLDRRPRQLSGGQRQRVAMGRAIVRNPKVFLFDEPLSNLDAKLRVSMRTEIKKLHKQVATTSVYVTHDQVEAMTLADRIVVMNEGIIEQIGSPDEVYGAPASLFVAGFMGSPTMNLLPATLARTAGGIAARLAGDIALPLPDSRADVLDGADAREVVLGVRPENILWAPERADAFEATVEVVEPLGSDTIVLFRIGADEVVCRLPPALVREAGARIRLATEPESLHLFDPHSAKAL